MVVPRISRAAGGAGLAGGGGGDHAGRLVEGVAERGDAAALEVFDVERGECGGILADVEWRADGGDDEGVEFVFDFGDGRGGDECQGECGEGPL